MTPIGESRLQHELQWLKARDIIANFLAEVSPHFWTRGMHEHNAAVIMARLAHADPPLLICTPDEMKD